MLAGLGCAGMAGLPCACATEPCATEPCAAEPCATETCAAMGTFPEGAVPSGAVVDTLPESANFAHRDKMAESWLDPETMDCLFRARSQMVASCGERHIKCCNDKSSVLICNRMQQVLLSRCALSMLLNGRLGAA